MAIHYVILADLLNSRNDFAFIDVSSDDVQSGSILAGGDSQVVNINLNTRYGVSTDLFQIPGIVFPALVIANFGSAVGLKSSVVLRQRKGVMAVPPQEYTLFTQFRFPLGDLANGAVLLVGNPSGIAASLSIAAGTTPIPTPPAVQPGTAAQIPITIPATRVNVASNVPVVLQVAFLGRGQEFSTSIITIGG